MENDESLRVKGRTYIPPNQRMRSLILNEAHKEVCMAHPVVTKMRTYLKPLLFLKGMKLYIVNYMERCLECH